MSEIGLTRQKSYRNELKGWARGKRQNATSSRAAITAWLHSSRVATGESEISSTMEEVSARDLSATSQQIKFFKWRIEAVHLYTCSCAQKENFYMCCKSNIIKKHDRNLQLSV